jgi:hypothetical protein
LKLANDSSVFAPKAGTLTREPGSLAGIGEVLAGEATTDDVDGGQAMRSN